MTSLFPMIASCSLERASTFEPRIRVDLVIAQRPEYQAVSIPDSCRSSINRSVRAALQWTDDHSPPGQPSSTRQQCGGSHQAMHRTGKSVVCTNLQHVGVVLQPAPLSACFSDRGGGQGSQSVQDQQKMPICGNTQLSYSTYSEPLTCRLYRSGSESHPSSRLCRYQCASSGQIGPDINASSQ